MCLPRLMENGMRCGCCREYATYFSLCGCKPKICTIMPNFRFNRKRGTQEAQLSCSAVAMATLLLLLLLLLLL